MTDPTLYVIAVGNPFDGLWLIGPFASGEEALEYAEDITHSEWSLVALEQPS